jgi:hypothetical protein
MLPHANRAALATFLSLAKPQNAAIEDNHHYQYFLRPDMTGQFEKAGLGVPGCAIAAEFEWDPPGGRPYRWGFLRLQVEVLESTLEGPVEIGDMVVEVEGGGGETPSGGEINGGGENPGAGNKDGDGVGRMVGEGRAKPAMALPSTVEEESEGEVSEED